MPLLSTLKYRQLSNGFSVNYLFPVRIHRQLTSKGFLPELYCPPMADLRKKVCSAGLLKYAWLFRKKANSDLKKSRISVKQNRNFACINLVSLILYEIIFYLSSEERVPPPRRKAGRRKSPRKRKNQGEQFSKFPFPRTLLDEHRTRPREVAGIADPPAAEVQRAVVVNVKVQTVVKRLPGAESDLITREVYD